MMATYFHGNSETQGGGDGLQTLILMNPSAYVGFSDTQQQQQQQPTQPQPAGNFFLLNHAAAAVAEGGASIGNSGLLNGTPFQKQHFVGVPLQAPATDSTSSQDHPNHHHQSVPSHFISAVHGVLPHVYAGGGGGLDHATLREVSRSQQGLSLSLSSQQQHQPPPGYRPFGPDREDSSNAVPPQTLGGGGGLSLSGVANGVHGSQSVVLSSKYLKAAQQLLDEVVNVSKAVIGVETAKEAGGKSKIAGDSSSAAAGGHNGGETNGKSAADLTTAERQEIQMKKAKLVNMLDEVEQRYRQYHQQMQIVISWFEQAAGNGSARTYTSLALQTISKQFRCLKDAISRQIRAAGRSLGEEDGFLVGGSTEGSSSSRLKSISNQIRQQRALQQLGMIQHSAWRPQRGLPERSVSVLRSWLFEHFLHPYPKDSDKIMLAKQTGLTRSQVSNWFINARVRLWKPMVEEMYMEEMKEKEQNGSEEDNKSDDHNSNEDASEDKNRFLEEQQATQPSTGINPNLAQHQPESQPCFSLIRPSAEIEGGTRGSPKKQRSAGAGGELLSSPGMMSMEPRNERQQQQQQGRDDFALTNLMGGFEPASYHQIGDMGRFNAEQFNAAAAAAAAAAAYSGNNGVSLTLGLPHCENLSIQGGHHHHQTFIQNQMGRGMEVGVDGAVGNEFSSPMSSYSNSVYDTITLQNRKRFTAQLLPDFVA